MIEKIVHVKNYVAKSGLPESDFVINPYVGCPHACKYCFASYMKKFTNHAEKWGTFTDVKFAENPIDTKALYGRRLTLSSVTDCYNPLEKKYEITRKILCALVGSHARITIITKSDLVTRDIDLLKKFENLVVASSINTLDENFKNDMDNAPPISRRLRALSSLHENGIKTVMLISPFFPGITDFVALIEKSKGFVDEYWFESLNLRGANRYEILKYIKTSYPQLLQLYEQIYIQNNDQFWHEKAKEIEKYCLENNIPNSIRFFHKDKAENIKFEQFKLNI